MVKHSEFESTSILICIALIYTVSRNLFAQLPQLQDIIPTSRTITTVIIITGHSLGQQAALNNTPKPNVQPSGSYDI